MLYAIIAVWATLIFPISATFVFFLDSGRKRAYLGVFLYDFIALIRGVFFYKNGGLFFLKGKKKTKIEPSVRKKIKAKIKPFYDFNVTKITFFYRLGGGNLPYYITFLTTFSEIIAKSVYKNLKPYLVINGYYDVYTERKVFDIGIKLKMRFNLLVIAVSLLKTFFNFLSEKINEKHSKGRQNKTGDRFVA